MNVFVRILKSNRFTSYSLMMNMYVEYHNCPHVKNNMERGQLRQSRLFGNRTDTIYY